MDIPDWRLVVAGSSLASEKDLVDRLRKLAMGSNIEVLDSIDYDRLTKLYSRAKIYWHAAGFGEDLDLYPERAEHFGISTVEAMAGGAVPVVINAGGQTEIVEEGENGFLWDSIEELKEKTLALINDSSLRDRLEEKAKKRANYFNEDAFRQGLEELTK